MPVQSDTFSLNLLPSSSAEVKLNLSVTDKSDEVMLNVYAVTRIATAAIPAGHEVAREQFGGNSKQFFTQSQTQLGKLEVSKVANK